MQQTEISPLKGDAPRLSAFQLAHALLVCLTGFQEGYYLCVVNSCLTPIQRDLQLCYPCEGGSSDAALAECTCTSKSLAVAILMVGAAAGGLTGGALADRFGRRSIVLLTAALFVAVAVMCTAAQPGTVWLFFVGRIGTGLCVGAGGTASVAFIAETAPREFRGALIQAVEVSLCVGCVVATLVALALGDHRWRATMAVPGFIAVVQLLGGYLFLYESPAWLEAQGRVGEARAAASALGLSSAHEKTTMRGAGKAVLAGVRFSRSLAMLPTGSDAVAARAAAQSGRHVRALAIAVGCAVAHDALAANAVLYYSRDILQSAGVGNALLAELFVGIVKCAGVIVTLLLVERTGRKPLLLVGTFGAMIGHAGMGWAFATEPHSQPLALASLFVFIFFWDLSWAGLMFMVAAEVLPLPIRGIGLGLVATVYWSGSFLWAFYLQELFEAVGTSTTFFMLSATTCGSLLFVALFVPETSEPHDAAAVRPQAVASKLPARSGSLASFAHILAEGRETDTTDANAEGET